MKHITSLVRILFFALFIFLLISTVAMVLSKRIFHLDLPILALWLVLSIIFTLRYKPRTFITVYAHSVFCKRLCVINVRIARQYVQPALFIMENGRSRQFTVFDV